MNSIIFKDEQYFPSKVICIGKNYAEHIKELNDRVTDQMVIFIKPNSAITRDGINIDSEDDIHYEAEISFLIKDNQYIAVGFGLDLTKRTVQQKLKQNGLPWERAKAFDGSAVFSDFIALRSDINEIKLELHINNVLVQQANYELMLNKPEQIMAEVQTFITLEDFDIIMTGTPRGVGKLNHGDTLNGKIIDNNGLIIEKTWVIV